MTLRRPCYPPLHFFDIEPKEAGSFQIRQAAPKYTHGWIECGRGSVRRHRICKIAGRLQKMGKVVPNIARVRMSIEQRLERRPRLVEATSDLHADCGLQG